VDNGEGPGDKGIQCYSHKPSRYTLASKFQWRLQLWEANPVTIYSARLLLLCLVQYGVPFCLGFGFGISMLQFFRLSSTSQERGSHQRLQRGHGKPYTVSR
jgi:hypothetical protein